MKKIVRKRAFDYIEDGVNLSGSDVEAAKDVVDRIKVTTSHCTAKSANLAWFESLVSSQCVRVFCVAGRYNLDTI